MPDEGFGALLEFVGQQDRGQLIRDDAVEAPSEFAEGGERHGADDDDDDRHGHQAKENTSRDAETSGAGGCVLRVVLRLCHCARLALVSGGKKW